MDVMMLKEIGWGIVCVSAALGKLGVCYSSTCITSLFIINMLDEIITTSTHHPPSASSSLKPSSE